MSLLVFAGAAQFIVMDLWHPVLPVATIVITVFAVNLRHVLMGAALYPWSRSLTPAQRYGSAFFITDENWALTMRELRQGEDDVGRTARS